MITAYQLMGVSPGFRELELKSAFRKRLAFFHPDRSRRSSTRDYLDFRRAYDILRDPQKREAMGELSIFGEHLLFQEREIEQELRQLFENLSEIEVRETGSGIETHRGARQ